MAQPVEVNRSSGKRKAQLQNAPKASQYSAKKAETTPLQLPHKYKTQMCKNFISGNPCPFGKNCNYAHGEEQLKKYTSAQTLEELPKVEEPKFHPEAPIFKSS